MLIRVSIGDAYIDNSGSGAQSGLSPVDHRWPHNVTEGFPAASDNYTDITVIINYVITNNVTCGNKYSRSLASLDCLQQTEHQSSHLARTVSVICSDTQVLEHS